MQQEAPRNASDRPETSSTATTVVTPAAEDQRPTLPGISPVPARFRLDERTRRIGLEGVAAAKALLAAQAERRAARDAEVAAAKAGESPRRSKELRASGHRRAA